MSTKSFKRPVFDDSLLLPQWIQYNGRYSPNHPLFIHSSLQSKAKIITWSEAAQAIENAAHFVCSHLKLSFQKDAPPPVVGILANLDAITYHTLLWGIVMAGGTAFLISTRNSPLALSHLLRKTGTGTLLVSADEPMQLLASSALADLGNHNVTLHTVPSFHDLYTEGGPSKYTGPIPAHQVAHPDSPAVILHSSGSTAFPKPISLTHRLVLQWSRQIDGAGVDMTNHRFAAHAVPVFHGLGYFLVPWATLTGMTLAVFPPQEPPIVPSIYNLLESAVSSKSTIILSVPLFIELWSRSAEGVEKLKQFDLVIYSGGALNKAIGDELWRAGISLASLYGATELGPVTRLAYKRSENTEWDWITTSPSCDPRFLPQDEPDAFELIFVECPSHPLPAPNIEFEGKRAFATNDLVKRHPSDPSKFKVLGRKDDQIMLSTGEKTNPGPMETIICRNPLVQIAVMFGRGQPQNGILLQPAKENQIDPHDEVALARYRNKVWSSVEQANTYAPTHSRIYKEMILVTHPSKPMELTAKLTPRRPIVLQAYKKEIEAAYSAIEESAQTEVKAPSAWTQGEVLEYVRATVHTIMRKDVRDEDDIFQNGGDSLQATFIRNSILRDIRQTRKEAAAQISQDFVYTHPSINDLTTRLLAIQVDPASGVDEEAHKVEKLMDMISELSVAFPVHHPSSSQKPSNGEVVLLTGATGTLGAQLLSLLASSGDVTRVYVLNRKSDDGINSLRGRQADALARRGLDVHIIDHPKVTLIQGDTATDQLGLDHIIFNEIRDNVTLIIHAAWRVNFGLTLDTFKPLIRGVRNLIDLALQSPRTTPPRFIFTGTVGVYTNWKTQVQPLEAPIEDATLVLGTGYSQSKWVSERLLEEAAKTTPLRPIIVRIGQLTSNSSGAWNSGDWLPTIVRSGQVLGALPSRDDSVAWLSVETAAQALFEFRKSSSQYLHLTHPSPVPWRVIFDVFSSMLNVPLVPWKEWLARLEKDDSGPKINPAVHLLDFFQSASSVNPEYKEALGTPLLDLTEALKSSPTLAVPSLPRIGREDAEKWIKYWRKTGFLTA